MYRCYACGKEIEHPGELCPFCKFPVISTLHGEKGEEEQIRLFAEEYKKANPQYFSNSEPKAATANNTQKIPVTQSIPEVPVQSDVPDQSETSVSASDPVEIDWKKRLEELLRREQLLNQRDEELKKREADQKKLAEDQRKREEEQRKKEEEQKKQAEREKLLEENQKKLETHLQQMKQEKPKKKKTAAGFLMFLLICVICTGLYIYFKRPDLIKEWFGSDGRINEIVENIKPSETETAAATQAPKATESETEKELMPVLSAEIGDLIYFGEFEQDNDLNNGKEPLAWRVIDVSSDGNKVLLLSVYSLSNIPYNPGSEDADWLDSYARSWLNDELYDYSFTYYEKSIILTVSGGNIYEFRKASSYDTDSIFCLSAENVQDLLPDPSDRLAQNTPYAQQIMKEQMLINFHYPNTEQAVSSLVADWEQKYGERCSWWWLKDPGVDITAWGELKTGSMLNDLNSIRPALWLDLEKARNLGIDLDIESGGIG